MAVPAGWSHAEIIMTLIAKIGLVRVTRNTGVREAHLILLVRYRDRSAVGVPYDVCSPLVEYGHMIFAHVRRRAHALLFPVTIFGFSTICACQSWLYSGVVAIAINTADQ